MRGDTKMEYRVRWRRPTWAPTTIAASKVFQRATGYQKFITRLWDRFPDAEVNVTVRRVESWEAPAWWEGWRRAGD